MSIKLKQSSNKYFLIVVVSLLTATLGINILKESQTVSALNGWQAGNIISDSVMANKRSMSASKIQSFLNSKVSSCDTYGTQPSEYGGGTRAQWAKSKYNQSKFICLKDYSEDGKKASKIIYDVAQKYSINPQVLLVVLQKEQGLITDTWPLNIQYKTATGYGCPDTAACDKKYFGLTNQLDWTGKMYRAILDNSPNWYTPYELGKNYIQYSPDSSCGGSTVNIENRATQALYNYTPYQPNKAALNAGMGSAPCGAYGNRNFYIYFNNWFGSTRSGAGFKSMDKARWMQLKESTQKTDPFTKAPTGSMLAKDQQIFFDSKIVIGGKTYLRTEYDTQRQLSKVIPLSKLSEVSVDYASLEPSRWMEVEKDLYKIDPQTKKKRGGKVSAGTWLYGSTKTEIANTLYIRSKYDTANKLQTGIPYTVVKSVTPEYNSLESPRWLIAKQDTKRYDLRYTGGSTTPIIPSGTMSYFDQKVGLNGNIYVTDDKPAENNFPGTPLKHLRSIASNDIKLRPTAHRAFKVTSSVTKTDVTTNKNTGRLLSGGSIIYIQGYIDIGSERYLRSAFDTVHENTTVLPRDVLEPVPVAFEKMSSPRNLKLRINDQKIDPVTKLKLDAPLTKSRVIPFSQKITIDGVMYLRTKFDSRHGHYKVIPMSSLTEVRS